MSAERLSIPVDQISVPEDYVRPVDEAAALVLARLLDIEGQKTPIAVYRSTARDGGRKPFTLIYGARRLWAAKHLGRRDIDAVLRTKDEAPMLAIADNFSLPTLDALEQGEHVSRFADLWIEENGRIAHGGYRGSRFHRETLMQDRNKLEKSGFYKDLGDKLGISKTTAWRLLRIGGLDPDLRTVLRGTIYAKDHTYLRKLTKLDPSKQAGIAAALKIEPNLDAVLRMDDPTSGRKGIGRQDRKEWNRERFRSAWGLMSEVDKREALEEIGAFPRLIDGWPEINPTVGVAAPGNHSPLWSMIADPISLRQHVSVEEIRDGRAALKIRERYNMVHAINERERALAEPHKAEVAKAIAQRSRKPKPGRPAHTPEMKRQKSFQKWFIPELATNMLEREEVGVTHWAVRYCRKLDAKEQFWVACHLGNGHRVDDIPWRVARSREDEAREAGQDQN